MKKQYYFGGIAVLILLASFIIYKTYRPTDSPEQRASATVAACAESEDHSSCYERLVPEMYPELSISQIFDVIRAIRQMDESYQFCHVLAHKIGERVVADDPSKWVDALPLNPTDGLCSNGFIHGVIGGRFRSEVLSVATIATLLPDFKRACEPHDNWHPSDLDKAMCYHAMGHLYVYITDADLDRALGLCEKATPEQFRRVCREGVFMQIYQPLEPDDFALIARMKVAPTPGTVRTFCATFKKPEYVGACLRESWPMSEGLRDGIGINAFCSGQPNATEEEACFQSATTIVGRMSLGNSQKATAACDRLANRWRELCYTTVAQAVLEENRNDAQQAIAVCNIAPDPISRSCITTLITRAPFIFGQNSTEMRGFCAAVPKDLRSQCPAQGS